jgi:hypothetical protein
LVRNSFAAAALANSASFSPSTAVGRQRLVSFINVVGLVEEIRSPAETAWISRGGE